MALIAVFSFLLGQPLHPLLTTLRLRKTVVLIRCGQTKVWRELPGFWKRWDSIEKRLEF